MVIGERMFKLGSKQVFLPSHLVTMLRPKPTTPPTLATFRVPLTFNKLDMRDYLLHAYKVETAGIRSLVAQQPIDKPKPNEKPRRVRRPRSIKLMIVELVKPFVWPAEARDASAWKQPEIMEQALKKQDALMKKMEETQKTGKMLLRDEQEKSRDDRQLREQAKALLEQGGWDNQRTLDPKFAASGKK
ncbi:uncharacterized protein B0I36DRAFT_323176 [Microdochium trichocladiopsis]|uniref:Large ribosomal subunit protein uL23m n=1 Tax=Microdochium trichocladiopsis TaxID=1682393 RepID=A0A9P8Y6K0_9PEZI|nr:uncharacterized protein B0I36DRAFT_323176 [Microdochium trichocladiopsis]KAH7031090.1 hypothetical protein B0I36DRAFT_323176 [Microdochium trichocladiopsis]